eukprot:COSAG01_NODE_4716_length_4795_cov_28.658007_4_plen_338_part_01
MHRIPRWVMVQLARTRSTEEQQRRAMADTVALAELSIQAQLDAELAATEAEIIRCLSDADGPHAESERNEDNLTIFCTADAATAQTPGAEGEESRAMATAARAPPSGDVDGESVARDDLAKHLYPVLRSEDVAAATRCIAKASDDKVLVRSIWRQQDMPPWILGEEDVTSGLTALHVLARDCHDVALVRRAVARAPQALSERAGITPESEQAAWNPRSKLRGSLPMHLAALNNGSKAVVRLLLEIGGAEQLQVKNEKGALPMHLAAQQNSCVDVVRLLLEIGGAEQLQVKDQDGDLPMHSAAWKNSSVDVVRLLLEIGGAEQLQVKNEEGALPMHLAA